MLGRQTRCKCLLQLILELTMYIYICCVICRNKVEIMRVKVGSMYYYDMVDCELPIYENVFGI